MSAAVDVAFPRGSETLRGHLSRSQTSGQRGAVVLVPDVYGLSPLYREIAGRFADRGFTTLAVDLCTRKGTPKLSGPAEAIRWIAGLSDPRVLGDLQAAIDSLAVPGVRIGITGFCMEGQYALPAACSVRGLSACVSFYGMLRYAERNEKKPRSPLDAAGHLSCPYLGIFGEDDVLIPGGDVAELGERPSAAGKRFEIKSYPGCGHAFLNRTRPDAYRPEAAADAFERAAGFFEAHLSPGR
jgi:carboxymethylenebutenolidase